MVAVEFPAQSIAIPTRMIDVTPKGVWRGDAIAISTPAVVVAVRVPDYCRLKILLIFSISCSARGGSARSPGPGAHRQ